MLQDGLNHYGVEGSISEGDPMCISNQLNMRSGVNVKANDVDIRVLIKSIHSCSYGAASHD